MKNLVFFSLIVFLLSCSSTKMTNSTGSNYVIEVDSYGEDSTVIGKNCYLFLADSTVNITSMQFVEFHNHLRDFFIQRQYNVVDSFYLADIIILYNYGISDPKTKDFTMNLPVWGQTGTSSTSTTGNITGSPYSNNIQYNQNTTRTPSYGVTGYNPIQGSITTYLRYLNLVAFDMEFYKKTKQEKRIWQAYITSSGTSDDLRKIFPYMLIGASNFIGHSSKEKKEITINENNPDVLHFTNR